MTFIIKNVEIIFHIGLNGYIMRVRVWVLNPSNVNKNSHLVAMLVHGLYFILNFKVVVFMKSTIKTIVPSGKF
jgi:hypothetical protein